MELMGEYPTILMINTLEIKKSTYYRHLDKRGADTSHQTNREEKDQELLKEIKTLLKEHPLWGKIDSQSQKNSQQQTKSHKAKRDTWHGRDKVLDKWLWMDKSHNSD